MSKAQRDKGRRGQTAAEHLLKDRDWIVDQITAGIKREDIVATDPNGKAYSVEVKNCLSITTTHRHQAMRQAKERGLSWMLMSKIAGTTSWLIQQGDAAGIRIFVWSEKKRLL